MCKWIALLAVPVLLAATAGLCQEKTFVMSIHTLSPEDGIVKPGQSEVVLEVHMLNTSHRPVVVNKGNPVEDYIVDIRDALGIRPADTDYGTRLKKSAASDGKSIMTNRNIAITLKPGESGTDVIPIGMMYDMRKVGKYSV